MSIKTKINSSSSRSFLVSSLLHDATLTISGERKHEVSSELGFFTERFYGKYQRSLTLPTPVDPGKVKASYRDGLLQVVLPKAEEAKPKQIEVALQ